MTLHTEPSALNQICNEISTVTTNWFVNRCPIVTRTPRLPVGSTTFSMISRNRDSSSQSGPLQFCQTWQHPVQIGGSLQASNSYSSGTGYATPFKQNKMIALQNLMDDMEVSTYYGEGEDPCIAARPKQKGLRALLTTNRTTEPQNADAYTASDFIRDTLEKCRVNGGDPDVLLVSSNFITGFAAWGEMIRKIDAGTTIFGTVIDVFEAPFLGGVSIIASPLLKPSTAVALTSSEVRMRMKRLEFWNPRGSRGDEFEGEWVAEGAVEIENESYHAWLEGVKAFAVL